MIKVEKQEKSAKTCLVETELDRAIKLATEYHKGQVDKQGNEYITHLMRVMNAVRENEKLMVGAILHDILEDTDCTTMLLADGGISGENIELVCRLTRRPEETYFDYINREGQDASCAVIKIADLKDNLRDGCPDSLRKRYIKALDILQNGCDFTPEP